MRPDDFAEELHKRPFKPFRIHLADGTTYVIQHPELVMVGRSLVLIGKPAEGYTGIFALYDTVSLIHIVRLEAVEPPATQAAG